MTSPTLTLDLEPQPTGIHVTYTVREPEVGAGQALCRLPIVVAGIPGAPIRAADLTVTDGLGELPLHEEDESPSASITYRRWCAARDTVGDVTVSYFAPVRHVDASTRNGPLFDLRAESGGVCGAGVSFLALPDSTRDYAVTVRWDGVSSNGEGTVEFVGPVERLMYCFYLAGPVHQYPADPAALSTYWLSEPPFDIRETTARVERVYEVLCDFFREPSPGHRMFLRKHPYHGNGGTALHRSFALGWSDTQAQTADELSNLLAHEITHNWPRLDGDHGETSWYSEGTAEYYSIMLPHRAGLIDDATFLELVNDRVRGYCTNPLQTLTTAQAAELYWTDPRAQRVPYGRGLFYLIDLNAKIHAASDGKRSVDDLVLTVLERQRAGENVSVADWIALVTDELGDQGAEGFAALDAGEWVVPPTDALGSRFTRHEITDHVMELGFDFAAVQKGVVTGLRPDSAAAHAGIHEGDRLLRVPTNSELTNGGTVEVSLTLERDERTFEVTYKPVGALVRSFRWS